MHQIALHNAQVATLYRSWIRNISMDENRFTFYNENFPQFLINQKSALATHHPFHN